MRIKGNYILCGINILTAILFIIIAFLPNNLLRTILGIPVIIFFPGYTLLTALFPSSERLGGIERIVFSFGLSLATVPLIGLILNYMPWGIHLYSILISLFIFIMVMSIIAWYRGWRLPEEERILLKVKHEFPSLVRLWSSQNQYNKIFTVLLSILILASIGVTGYVIGLPRYGTKYTEFYFPQKITSPMTIVEGQNTNMVLAIINHEKETDIYRIEIIISGNKVNEIDNITLNNDEEWQKNVNFAPTQVGENQKIEFLLYKGSATDIYRQLVLWVDVVAKS